jgi:hypothetical protein
MVFETAKTATIIIKYLQKAFLPVKEDSRWFMDQYGLKFGYGSFRIVD